MRQVIFIIIISSSFTTIAQTYDRQAATDYANYWWDGRNTMNGEKSQTSYDTAWGNPYNNYNGLGGDCANFVSQCLIAGGLEKIEELTLYIIELEKRISEMERKKGGKE